MKITVTNCSECIHDNVCKHKGEVNYLKNKFENMQYGEPPNGDYAVKDINPNVDVDFKCPDFHKSVLQRGGIV